VHAVCIAYQLALPCIYNTLPNKLHDDDDDDDDGDQDRPSWGGHEGSVAAIWWWVADAGEEGEVR
jgi:hypothetical protein